MLSVCVCVGGGGGETGRRALPSSSIQWSLTDDHTMCLVSEGEGRLALRLSLSLFTKLLRGPR